MMGQDQIIITDPAVSHEYNINNYLLPTTTTKGYISFSFWFIATPDTSPMVGTQIKLIARVYEHWNLFVKRE
jgi:hypothetical protein